MASHLLGRVTGDCPRGEQTAFFKNALIATHPDKTPPSYKNKGNSCVRMITYAKAVHCQLEAASTVFKEKLNRWSCDLDKSSDAADARKKLSKVILDLYSSMDPTLDNCVLSFEFKSLDALPPEISWLGDLKELHLRGSHLITLPPEVAFLPKLDKLVLNCNTLLTSLPDDIWDGVKQSSKYFPFVLETSRCPSLCKHTSQDLFNQTINMSQKTIQRIGPFFNIG